MQLKCCMKECNSSGAQHRVRARHSSCALHSVLIVHVCTSAGEEPHDFQMVKVSSPMQGGAPIPVDDTNEVGQKANVRLKCG